MPFRTHSEEKFIRAGLILSSEGRGWTNLHAELRSHSSGILPAYTATATEVAILLSGSAKVTREAGDVLQQTFAHPGAIWLCPAGLREEFVEVDGNIEECLHLYIPSQSFMALGHEFAVDLNGTSHLRYEAGFDDGLIKQIARTVVTELKNETSSGAMLIDGLTVGLAAFLLAQHGETAQRQLRSSAVGALDRGRLARVIDYIHAHPEETITLEKLASVACLSQFHFSRAFKQATGKTPHQYLSERRLELSKSLLVKGQESLSDIALICNFSSQANFNRAFLRAMGITPGQFRAAAGRSQGRVIRDHLQG